MLAITILLTLSISTLGQTNTASMEQRMKTVIIPSIEFRQADPAQALAFLIEASTAEPPTNIPCLGLIETNRPPALLKRYELELEDGTPLELPALTLECRRITMLEAIQRVTARLGLSYIFEQDQLILLTEDGRRIRAKESVEQSGPAYPPQGVGSADP